MIFFSNVKKTSWNVELFIYFGLEVAYSKENLSSMTSSMAKIAMELSLFYAGSRGSTPWNFLIKIWQNCDFCHIFATFTPFSQENLQIDPSNRMIRGAWSPSQGSRIS